MAAPEVPQPGVINPGYMQPTHYSPGQMANIPWITPLKGIGEQISKGAQDIQQTVMQSPLNPAVKAEMDQRVKESQFNQKMMQDAMNDKTGLSMYRMGFHGLLGADVAPLPLNEITRRAAIESLNRWYAEHPGTPPPAAPGAGGVQHTTTGDSTGAALVPTTPPKSTDTATPPKQPDTVTPSLNAPKPLGPNQGFEGEYSGSTATPTPTPKPSPDPPPGVTKFDEKEHEANWWLGPIANALEDKARTNPDLQKLMPDTNQPSDYVNGMLHYKSLDGKDQYIDERTLQDTYGPYIPGATPKPSATPSPSPTPNAPRPNFRASTNQGFEGEYSQNQPSGPPGPGDNLPAASQIAALNASNTTPIGSDQASQTGGTAGGPAISPMIARPSPGQGDIGGAAGGSAVTPPATIASPQVNQQFDQPPPIQHPIVSAQTVKETLAHWDTNLSKANVAYVPFPVPGYRVTTTGSKNGGGNTTFLPLTTYMKATGGAGGSDNIGMVMHMANQHAQQVNGQLGATGGGPTGPPPAPGGQDGQLTDQNGQTVGQLTSNQQLLQNPQNLMASTGSLRSAAVPTPSAHDPNDPNVIAEKERQNKVNNQIPNAPDLNSMYNYLHDKQVNSPDGKIHGDGNINGDGLEHIGVVKDPNTGMLIQLYHDPHNPKYAYMIGGGTEPGKHIVTDLQTGRTYERQDNDYDQNLKIMEAMNLTYDQASGLRGDARDKALQTYQQLHVLHPLSDQDAKEMQFRQTLYDDTRRYRDLLSTTPEGWGSTSGQLNTLVTRIAPFVKHMEDAYTDPQFKDLTRDQITRGGELASIRSQLMLDAENLEKAGGPSAGETLNTLGQSHLPVTSHYFNLADLGPWGVGKDVVDQLNGTLKSQQEGYMKRVEGFKTGNYYLPYMYSHYADEIQKNGQPDLPAKYTRLTNYNANSYPSAPPASESNRLLKEGAESITGAIGQHMRAHNMDPSGLTSKTWPEVTEQAGKRLGDIGKAIGSGNIDLLGPVKNVINQFEQQGFPYKSRTYSEGPNAPRPPIPNATEYNPNPTEFNPAPGVNRDYKVQSEGPNTPHPEPPYNPQAFPYKPTSDVPPGQGHHPDAPWYPGKLTNAEFARKNVPRGTWVESPPGHVWQVT